MRQTGGLRWAFAPILGWDSAEEAIKQFAEPTELPVFDLKNC
jgi:hypothetical protein